MVMDRGSGMQTYLVGGAVRDALLGLPVSDRDHVVVGATVQDMLQAGFKPVGAEFPVFLHPVTAEEYALARTERKHGHGYGGFIFHAAPEVSLEEDLARRDLTINAIAQAADGTLIDPYGGREDLRERVLRHVSPAFVEDPLRVLRVARFAARYAPLGFRVAPATLELMRQLAESGELAHLTAERVWAELRRALVELQPSQFLRVLRQCGALQKLLPEVDALYGVPQRAEFHPEIDTGLHQEMVCDAIARLAPGDELAAWCALVHDLGKALTPVEQLPRHLLHERNGLAPLRQLAQRLKVPREFQQLGLLVCAEHLLLHQLHTLRPGTILELLERLDAFRKPQRLRTFGLACQADKQGRLGAAAVAYPNAALLQRAHAAAAAVGTAELLAQGLSGPELGVRLRQQRLLALKQSVRTAQQSDPTSA